MKSSMSTEYDRFDLALLGMAEEKHKMYTVFVHICHFLKVHIVNITYIALLGMSND